MKVLIIFFSPSGKAPSLVVILPIMMMSVFSAGTAYRSLPKAATSNNASHPNQAKEISRQQLNLNILQKRAVGNLAKFGHALLIRLPVVDKSTTQ
jgi:hypothetical protein